LNILQRAPSIFGAANVVTSEQKISSLLEYFQRAPSIFGEAKDNKTFFLPGRLSSLFALCAPVRQ
jgi:hypothetical protein